MTTVVITKDAVYTDNRGTRSSMISDHHEKFIRWPEKDMVFFIVGAATTGKDAVNFIMTGQWRDEETKQKFISLEDGCEAIVLDNNGFVKFSELVWDKEKQDVIIRGVGDLIEPDCKDLYSIGSGSAIAYGAFEAAEGNMDKVYKTINMINACTSASYHSVCRSTRKVKFHKGL